MPLDKARFITRQTYLCYGGKTPDHERNGLMNILIKNGRIWDGEKFFRGDVLTDGKKISKIEENISCDADFIYDATEKTVSAGLIDAHIHIKGISSDDFGINADMSCIPFGVTTALDASGILGNKSLLESFSVKAFTLVKADFKNGRADLRNAEKCLKKYLERAIGIKIYLPEADTISQIYEVCEFAEKHKLIIMVHTTDSKIPMREVLNALRKGDIFTHAYHGGKNNVEEDDFECLKAAQSRGVIIDAGLAGNVHTDFRIFKNAVLNGAAPDIISTDITKLKRLQKRRNIRNDYVHEHCPVFGNAGKRDISRCHIVPGKSFKKRKRRFSESRWKCRYFRFELHR